MKSHFLQIAVASCLILGGEATFVEQSPAHLSVHFRTTELITCVLKNMEYPWMSWYWQDAKGQLEFLFVLRSKGDKEKTAGPGGSYTAERISETELRLEIANASVSQMIYCTCSTDNYEAFFGEGTRLTVLEKDVPNREPNVVLFDPSPLEISQKKKATLVCLATNFYPGYVTLTWSVNGKNRTEGVKTDDDAKQDGGSRMYSLSSRLRLSMQEWFNARNSFQCTVHMYHPDEKDVQRTIMGQEGCGLSEESYRRHATSAKFTYILFLCKAALYGFIVTVLVWRFKGSDKQFT